MARLGSRAKAGFYPTPDTVCWSLKRLLDMEDNARLLDPCCGEGKTLLALADGANGETDSPVIGFQRAEQGFCLENIVAGGGCVVVARPATADGEFEISRRVAGGQGP